MDFESDKKKGYTFGLSRKSVSKRYIHEERPRDPAVPGPGSYKEKEILGKNGQVYSMSTKASIIYAQRAPKIPGPGQYDSIKSLTQSGTYFLSTLSNSCAQKMSPPSSLRFPIISKLKRGKSMTWFIRT